MRLYPPARCGTAGSNQTCRHPVPPPSSPPIPLTVQPGLLPAGGPDARAAPAVQVGWGWGREHCRASGSRGGVGAGNTGHLGRPHQLAASAVASARLIRSSSAPSWRGPCKMAALPFLAPSLWDYRACSCIEHGCCPAALSLHYCSAATSRMRTCGAGSCPTAKPSVQVWVPAGHGGYIKTPLM